jgi:pantoate--beta-alanine ligase
MIELGDPRQMLEWSQARRGEGKRVGFVATMGYLHEGHLRLIDRARERSDAVVVSVFVNPLQFGPTEDFARYPRDPDRDRLLAARRGADCLFVPDRAAMYPTEPLVRVEPGALATHLCGRVRPGHFAGVLTVVAKLFHMVEPDVAVFGRKDAQQAIIIQRMVTDLDFPVAIDVAPIVREADGLAMSSRNAYLSAEEREAAPALSRALDAAHAAFDGGERDAGRIVAAARSVLDAEHRLRLEYLEAVDPETLQPAAAVDARALVAVAAYGGETRLIDNVILGDGTAGDPRVRA